jgi:hypothetical protein
LQTADATLGNALDGNRIEELPLNARNIVGLLSGLVPLSSFPSTIRMLKDCVCDLTVDGNTLQVNV